jgi:hypothetical protein
MCREIKITEEEIIDGNKLIAEFMELYYDDGDWRDNNGTIHSLYEFHYGIIPYHTSWEWLMGVVEKIGGTYINGMQLGTEISGSKGYYSCIVFGTHISGENEDPKIAVWNCVVKFIKWYNKENIEGKMKIEFKSLYERSNPISKHLISIMTSTYDIEMETGDYSPNVAKHHAFDDAIEEIKENYEFVSEVSEKELEDLLEELFYPYS